MLTKEGHDDLVVKGRARRVIKPSLVMRAKMYVRTLPRNALMPFWVMKTAAIFLLHFIPIVGPLLLILVAAPKRGKSTHGRYFELKGFSPAEVRHFVEGRRGQYTG